MKLNGGEDIHFFSVGKLAGRTLVIYMKKKSGGVSQQQTMYMTLTLPKITAQQRLPSVGTHNTQDKRASRAACPRW
jgi:hypothetical protein